MRRDHHEWVLTGERPEQSARTAVEASVSASMLRGRALVPLGGTGQVVSSVLHSRLLSRGSDVAIAGIDNASINQDEIVLADGTTVPFPAQRWLRLRGSEDRMALLRAEPELLHWFEQSGLLATVSAARLNDRIGNGGGGEPLAGLIDYLLHIDDFRHHIREGLRAAWQPHATHRRGLARHLEQARPEPCTVIVVAGLDGTAGNAGSLLAGYLIREQARLLGQPTPTVFLVACGPNSHRGMVEHWQVNYAAGLAALRYATRHGIDLPLPGGQRLRATGEPPYDTVLLCDDSPRVEVATQESVRAFAARVAIVVDALLDNALRNQLLDHVAALHPHDEWGRFMTVTVGASGADRVALRSLLSARIAARRARMLSTSLAAA